jgi:hypothetical protein
MKIYIQLIVLLFMTSCSQEENPFLIENVFFPCYDEKKFGSLKPDDKNGFPINCLPLLADEQFNKSKTDWTILNNTNVTYSLSGGFYTMISKNNTNWYNGIFYTGIEKTTNYEIETSVKLSKSNNINSTASIYWGETKDLDDVIEFGFTNDGRYYVRKIINKLFQPPIISLKTSFLVKKNDFNKITIRLYKGVHFIFINDTLAETIKNIAITGKRFGFSVPALSEINIDWVSLKILDL